MKTIVLDLQSGLYANALRRALVQNLTEAQVVISPTPGETVEHCRVTRPNALLMEVKPFSPWLLPERLKLREEVGRVHPDCKVALLVDEAADRALTEEVKRAKQEGRIDAFLFDSASESYLAATLDSL